jgi:hypothetical protein
MTTATLTAQAWCYHLPTGDYLAAVLADARARGMTRIEFRNPSDPFVITKEVNLCPPR